MEGHLLTPEQVAERLQIAERTVYLWLRQGRMQGLKLGRLWRVREEDVEDFLDRHRSGSDNEEDHDEGPSSNDLAGIPGDIEDVRAKRGNTLEPCEAEREDDDPTAEEDREWLDADLGGQLPPYDWGSDGPPRGRPVRYIPGVGPVVEGGKRGR